MAKKIPYTRPVKQNPPSGSGPARAKEVAPEVPVRNNDAGVAKRQAQKAQKTELMKLREQIKTQAKAAGPKRSKIVATEARAKRKNPALNRAVREFNYTYKGAGDTDFPINVNKGLGPIQ